MKTKTKKLIQIADLHTTQPKGYPGTTVSMWFGEPTESGTKWHNNRIHRDSATWLCAVVALPTETDASIAVMLQEHAKKLGLVESWCLCGSEGEYDAWELIETDFGSAESAETYLRKNHAGLLAKFGEFYVDLESNEGHAERQFQRKDSGLVRVSDGGLVSDFC